MLNHELLSLAESTDKKLITPEIHKTNDFYGNASVLKAYAGLQPDYPLKLVVDHRMSMIHTSWHVDTNASLPSIICFAARRIPFYRKITNKAIFPVGPYIHYCSKFVDKNFIKEEKKRLGYNLLVFPVHSTHHVQNIADIEVFCNHLEKYKEFFDNIRICMYWKNILDGEAEYFLKRGYECVTAGHMFNANFLTRLRTLIEISDSTLSNSVSNHIGYSIYLKKPHTIIDIQYTRTAKEKKYLREGGTLDTYNHPKSKYFFHIFNNDMHKITQKQLDIADKYWGFSNVKKPKQLKEILLAGEDMHQRGKSFFMNSDNILLDQIDHYILHKETNKANFLLEQAKQSFPSDNRVKKIERFLNIKINQNFTSQDVVIASYPKSGNNWLRLLISDLILQINGFETDTQLPIHQDRIIPDIHKHDINFIDERITLNQRIIKSHHPFDPIPDKTIFLFRDPADCLCPYYYFHKRYDNLVNKAKDGKDIFCLKHMKEWIEHTNSYLNAYEQNKQNILFVSYEALHEDPYSQLGNIADHLGIKIKNEMLFKAINNHTFFKHHNREKLINKYNELFFRKGQVGYSRYELSNSTINAIARLANPIYKKCLSHSSCIGPKPSGDKNYGNFHPEQIQYNAKNSKNEPESHNLSSKPIYKGSLAEALDYLKNNHSKIPRRKPGSIILDNIKLFYADLHSFYHELNQIFAKNLYGFETKSDAPVIIDCGAHVGLATLYFASRYPNAKIYSFEADPDIHTLFKANIQNTNLNNVTSYAKAVWIHGKGVTFDQSGDDSGHIDQKSNNLVPSIRLKNFISDFEKIDMLKLDVEGAEFEILEDCLPVLDRVQKIIIEVHAFSDDQKPLSKIFGTIDNAGFNYVISDHHIANWLTPCNNPPFNFLNNDKYIFTVYAWKADYIKKNFERKKEHHYKETPQIAQFCMQDFGGAGTAALRLHEGLICEDANNTFYVQNIGKWQKKTSLFSQANPPTKNGKFMSPEWQAFLAKNKEALSKYPNRPKGLEMFSITWATNKLEDIPGLEEADIINLHWISGTLSIPDNIDFLKGKKIVWTLHDMNPFTGGCHYAGECREYEKYCGNCPQLGSNQENDLSREIWKLKKSAYRELDITVVTPSHWLAKCAQKSSLFSPFPLHVIPYGLPTNIFKPYPKTQTREVLNIPLDSFVILFGAESVSNHRKGFIHLIEALEKLKEHKINERIILAVFGKNSKQSVEHLGFQAVGFDYVQNESELALLYSMSDVTVIPSLEDNLPNIVLESLACGTPVVGFDIGGIPDMIEHKTNGYLAERCDASGLAQGIAWICKQKKSKEKIRLQCRETTLKNYNLSLQARQYQKLYAQIVGPRSKNWIDS